MLRWGYISPSPPLAPPLRRVSTLLVIVLSENLSLVTAVGQIIKRSPSNGKCLGTPLVSRELRRRLLDSTQHARNVICVMLQMSTKTYPRLVLVIWLIGMQCQIARSICKITGIRFLFYCEDIPVLLNNALYLIL